MPRTGRPALAIGFHMGDVIGLGWVPKSSSKSELVMGMETWQDPDWSRHELDYQQFKQKDASTIQCKSCDKAQGPRSSIEAHKQLK